MDQLLWPHWHGFIWPGHRISYTIPMTQWWWRRLPTLHQINQSEHNRKDDGHRYKENQLKLHCSKILITLPGVDDQAPCNLHWPFYVTLSLLCWWAPLPGFPLNSTSGGDYYYVQCSPARDGSQNQLWEPCNYFCDFDIPVTLSEAEATGVKLHTILL